MTCGLLAGQRQRLWRMSSAWRRGCARSTSSSRVPVTLRILCWPSSVKERLTSSLSHRLRRLPPLPVDMTLTPALGTGTDGKACRKLFWERRRRKHTLVWESCEEITQSYTTVWNMFPQEGMVQVWGCDFRHAERDKILSFIASVTYVYIYFFSFFFSSTTCLT